MSNLVRHHRLRMMMNLTWRAEYVLAILQAEGECKTQYLREVGSGYDIIDTLNTLEERGLIKVRRPNGKLRMHSLTDLAREYLQQVEDIYVKS
jgi:DNA-binding PadR family transcriptional regulator